MRRMVEKILRYYGKEILVRTDSGEVIVRGFLQPVTGKGQNMAEITMSPLGVESLGQCVYIGPVEPEVAEGDVLSADGKEYLLRKVKQIDGTNGPAYRWGMCMEKGAEDLWGLSG